MNKRTVFCLHSLLSKCATLSVLVTAFITSLAAEDQKPAEKNSQQEESKKTFSAISSNPAAVNSVIGTGDLGRLIGFKDESGVRIGGMWIGDTNKIVAGGLKHGKWKEDSVFLLDLSLDTEKLSLFKGGLLGAEFLRFDGTRVNERAGSIQGYNGLIGPSPLHRSELYQLWYRQAFLDNTCIIRVGKSVPSCDFNNVLRPVPMQDESLTIPAVSGLIYDPIFVNTSMQGVLPGYYNSVYGVTATVAPTKQTYLSYGAYDGNKARGKQTGLRGPHFNGYYFHIGEAGLCWDMGENKMSGKIAVGAWRQTGKLTLKVPSKTLAPAVITQRDNHGIYAFASQRLWLKNPGVDNSGISGFLQFGKNNSRILPMHRYYGIGFTAFGLIPKRIKDSMGVGLAYSYLNKRSFARKKEAMYQGYYQVHLFDNAYFEPVVTYIPKPGASRDIRHTWTVTARMTFLF